MTRRFFSVNLVVFTIAIMVQLSSCDKDPVIAPPPPPEPCVVCDVRGTYSGSATSSTGTSITETYKLNDNNFAVGSITPEGQPITFGGYRNTCDSVMISAYYVSSGAYYLLQGKLSNNGATISGTFKNITVLSDYGTFSISK